MQLLQAPPTAATPVVGGDPNRQPSPEEDEYDALLQYDDEMDEHEVMLPLVQLIEKYSDPASWEPGAGAAGQTRGSAGRGNAGEVPAMPAWLSTLLEALHGPQTNR